MNRTPEVAHRGRRQIGALSLSGLLLLLAPAVPAAGTREQPLDEVGADRVIEVLSGQDPRLGRRHANEPAIWRELASITHDLVILRATGASTPMPREIAARLRQQQDAMIDVMVSAKRSDEVGGTPGTTCLAKTVSSILLEKRRLETVLQRLLANQLALIPQQVSVLALPGLLGNGNPTLEIGAAEIQHADGELDKLDPDHELRGSVFLLLDLGADVHQFHDTKQPGVARIAPLNRWRETWQAAGVSPRRQLEMAELMVGLGSLAEPLLAGLLEMTKEGQWRRLHRELRARKPLLRQANHAARRAIEGSPAELARRWTLRGD